MAWCTIQFVGKSIHKDTAMEVLLPEGDGPFPVLYLLHGLTHDYSHIHRATAVERLAAGLPLIVVMPEGHRNFYCNDPRGDGLAYEDHVIQDVIGFVDRMLPSIPRRTARAVAGMSMGGYGAMMLALRNPDVFSVVCSEAAAIFFAHNLERPAPVGAQAFAAALPRGRYDCFALARRHKGNPHRLAIRMGCGSEDGLLEPNRQFHAHLRRLGIAHEYVESPGAHNTGYFAANLPAVLRFATDHLRPLRPAASSARKRKG